MNVSTNGTLKLPPRPKVNQVIFIAQMTSLAVLGGIIILGNLASIITFIKTQSLRRRSHYLIISLSAADLLVGVVALMLLNYFLTGPKVNTYTFALDFLDTMTVMTSILTLSAISVERFMAILFPFHHRMLRFRAYVALSALPWVLATCLATIALIGYFKRSVYFAFIQISFVIIGLALLTILISYISLGCKMRRKSNLSAQNQNRAVRDKKLVVTLLIVTLSSLLTWMPLQGYIFVKILCKKCFFPDPNEVFLMKFLQFCNSGLNIFIYMVRIPEFRVAFLAIFCRRKERRIKRPNDTMQKTNQAFMITSDEDLQTRVTQSTAQVTELDDLKDIEESTFSQSSKSLNNRMNKIAGVSQANIQKRSNGDGEDTFDKSNHENTGTPGNEKQEGSQDSNERDIPLSQTGNSSASSKYEIAHDRLKDNDTPM